MVLIILALKVIVLFPALHPTPYRFHQHAKPRLDRGPVFVRKAGMLRKQIVGFQKRDHTSGDFHSRRRESDRWIKIRSRRWLGIRPRAQMSNRRVRVTVIAGTQPGVREKPRAFPITNSGAVELVGVPAGIRLWFRTERLVRVPQDSSRRAAPRFFPV